jgi:hypothetical protein
MKPNNQYNIDEELPNEFYEPSINDSEGDIMKFCVQTKPNDEKKYQEKSLSQNMEEPCKVYDDINLAFNQLSNNEQEENNVMDIGKVKIENEHAPIFKEDYLYLDNCFVIISDNNAIVIEEQISIELKKDIKEKPEPEEKKNKIGKPPKNGSKKKGEIFQILHTEGEYFPFTKGKKIIMDEKKFKTKKYISNESGIRKRKPKSRRKYKPDDIRKKIKARFHKVLKKIINKNLNVAGSQKLFGYMPQSFISNVNRIINHDYLNCTYEQILSTDFSAYHKKIIKGLKVEHHIYLKNKEVLEYLEKNPQISKISGFDKIKNMKYKEILLLYFLSEEFNQTIEELKEENEEKEYIDEYIRIAKNYIEHYSQENKTKYVNDDKEDSSSGNLVDKSTGILED